MLLILLFNNDFSKPGSLSRFGRADQPAPAYGRNLCVDAKLRRVCYSPIHERERRIARSEPGEQACRGALALARASRLPADQRTVAARGACGRSAGGLRVRGAADR